MDKQTLRNQFKIKRKYLNCYQREMFDIAMQEKFLEQLGDYESYFIYYSFGTEAGTHALIKELLNRGKRVYLPRIEGKDMLAVPYSEPLQKSAFGTEEPQGEAYTGEIDVTVCPFLAISDKGYRLGYGGGYYDKYLSHHQTIKVGWGYSLQQTDMLQTEAFDQPLDIWINEKGIIHFGNYFYENR
jgi:5-formyltetrahydrofolate cyclo-ligase